MTLPEIRRLPSPAIQPRETPASLSARAGNLALPAASFGVAAPRATSASAVAMKMPR